MLRMIQQKDRSHLVSIWCFSPLGFRVLSPTRPRKTSWTKIIANPNLSSHWPLGSDVIKTFFFEKKYFFIFLQFLNFFYARVLKKKYYLGTKAQGKLENWKLKFLTSRQLGKSMLMILLRTPNDFKVATDSLATTFHRLWRNQLPIPEFSMQ